MTEPSEPIDALDRVSRAAILEAADSERRRLERNLHDGAQQRLVALAIQLRAVAAAQATDPPTAGILLASAQDELALALEDLRALARGTHPAVLTDHGLRAALDALVAAAPLPVYVVALPEERFAASVEATVYYLVSEALTNAARHARASVVELRVGRAGGRLRVEVRDDGVGGAAIDGGSGLRGLVDRFEALGGRLLVHSPPGAGTTLIGEIPS
jgi:signal transduction histidine kinase